MKKSWNLSKLNYEDIYFVVVVIFKAVDMEHKSIIMKYFTDNGHKVGLIATDFGNYIKFRHEPYTFDELVREDVLILKKK